VIPSRVPIPQQISLSVALWARIPVLSFLLLWICGPRSLWCPSLVVPLVAVYPCPVVLLTCVDCCGAPMFASLLMWGRCGVAYPLSVSGSIVQYLIVGCSVSLSESDHSSFAF
jgi:hypothetical protein